MIYNFGSNPNSLLQFQVSIKLNTIISGRYIDAITVLQNYNNCNSPKPTASRCCLVGLSLSGFPSRFLKWSARERFSHPMFRSSLQPRWDLTIHPPSRPRVLVTLIPLSNRCETPQWYQSQTPNDVPTRRLNPKGGWTPGSVLAMTLGLERRWIVRSHIGWKRERSILYKGVKTSSQHTRFKTLRGSPKGKTERGQYLLPVVGFDGYNNSLGS